jgi:hypothetical protein
MITSLKIFSLFQGGTNLRGREGGPRLRNCAINDQFETPPRPIFDSSFKCRCEWRTHKIAPSLYLDNDRLPFAGGFSASESTGVYGREMPEFESPVDVGFRVCASVIWRSLR